MSDEKLKGTLYDDKEAVKYFRDFENRYYQQVTVTGVTGQCPYGHTEGEQYRVSNCNNDGLCGALYTSIHHSIVTLHYWGSLPWSKNPDTYLGMCPEMKVQVEIRRMEQEERNLLKTKAQPRNMVGKGFPVIDKYRAFIEIMDVDKYRHEHEKSSEWFKKNFLDFAKDTGGDRRDVHHHRIVEKTTGRIGEGFGWSYGQAEKRAWKDLKGR